MTDRTQSKSGKPAIIDGIDWPELDAPDLSSLSRSLAQACALISHTYSDASYAGFSQLEATEQKDYLWAIHSRLRVASRALSRVLSRRRFDTPENAAQEWANG